jgi:predicted enzyme related to lactoylglutathione lyase
MSEPNPRVTGIGGVFFKSPDPVVLRAWYHRHLGIPAGGDDYPGVEFMHADDDAGTAPAMTVWSGFKTDSTYFDPPSGASQPYMFNFRVNDLDGLLAKLAAADIQPTADTQVMEGIGKFSWIVDPDGRKIELWQPE